MSGSLPLLVEPSHPAEGLTALTERLLASPQWARERLLAHGALLFRGFGVGSAPDVERLARAIEPELANDYLGTSPRDAVTPYVFNASELPPYYPIPQHIEMSFVARPPRTLFFACLVEPQGPGGETPLVDFRAVLRDLEPGVRARFERLGVRNVRNYDGPASPKTRDLWKLKRWDEMFGTTDRKAVERRAQDSGFQVQWKPHDRLALVNTQPATRPHPETGEPVWFNHAQVFHPSAAAGEYRRIARRGGPRLRYLGLAALAEAMTLLKRLGRPEDQAMYCSYGDGSPIGRGELEAVREAIWKNMVFPRWRRGDVLAIDNRAIAHGRMPYRGPRHIVVAWA
jgi:alpha-ketoglutarate-dependent taurine dioxygenase